MLIKSTLQEFFGAFLKKIRILLVSDDLLTTQHPSQNKDKFFHKTIQYVVMWKKIYTTFTH